MTKFAPAITPCARRVQTLVAGPCVMAEAIYPPGFSMAPHAHERPVVTLVLAGGLLERNDGSGSNEAGACAVFLKPAESVHSNRFGSRGARTFVIELEGAPANALHERIRPGGSPIWLACNAATRATLRAHAAMRGGGAHVAGAVEEAVYSLLDVITPQQEDGAGAPAWLRHVRERIDDDPLSAASVSELAREAGVHPVHLTRVFRRVYGCSVAEHQRRTRVQRAARRVTDSGEPLARVAAASGFADQSHMGREIRRELGVTPASLRSIARS